MVTGTLYEPQQFEPLIDEPWAPKRMEDAIAAIVADADAAFDQGGALARDASGTRTARSRCRYHGAVRPVRRASSGVSTCFAEAGPCRVVARPGGRPRCARSSSSGRTPGRRREDEHYRTGRTRSSTARLGPLLVAFRLSSDAARADERARRSCAGNADNPDRRRQRPGRARDAAGGAGDGRAGRARRGGWQAARESATSRSGAAVARTELWRQDDDYRGLGTLHGVGGQHARAAPCRAGRSPLATRERVRSLATCVPRGRPSELARLAAAARSRGHETAGSVCSGAPARRASSAAPGSISTRTSCSPAPS